MTRASDRERTANLLAALALATADRVRAVTEAATGRPTSDTTALVILTTALQGASQDRLGAVLGLSQSGAARLVDRLALQGLLQRRPGPDGRTWAVAVTAAGDAAARAALQHRQDSVTALLGVLADAEQAQLTSLLEKLLTGLTRDGAEAYRICRLCDPDACGHYTGRCPVTCAAAQLERISERESTDEKQTSA